MGGGGGRGVGANFILFSEFLLFFFRGPCKNLKPYDNPFCGFEYRWSQEKRLIT
jgi:hypothetical protein